MCLVDVGAGDGLVGFRAIERIGPKLRVVLTDVSIQMLRHAEALAVQRGVLDQCTFLEFTAEHLTGIADASVDVVTTRSVLAYVSDKSAALREFQRVLKPGGCISIAEPIFRDDALSAIAMKNVLNTRSADSQDRFLPLLHRWKSAQFPDTEAKMAQSPITNYVERDLVRFAKNCGFADIHLELHIDVRPSRITSWAVLLGTSPHPLAPSLSVILAEQFNAEERQFFEKILRPIVESGNFDSTGRMAYLTARKPVS